jgi:hypothetical protein
LKEKIYLRLASRFISHPPLSSLARQVFATPQHHCTTLCSFALTHRCRRLPAHDGFSRSCQPIGRLRCAPELRSIEPSNTYAVSEGTTSSVSATQYEGASSIVNGATSTNFSQIMLTLPSQPIFPIPHHFSKASNASAPLGLAQVTLLNLGIATNSLLPRHNLAMVTR